MKFKYIILVLAAIAAVSCQKADQEFDSNLDPNAVRIEATVGGVFTRSNPLEEGAASSVFKTNDVVTVAAEAQGAVGYTFNGTTWSAEAGKYLRWDAPTMNFKAWYPQTASMTDFTLPTDQSTTAGIESADYMTYSGSHTKDGTNPISLTLQRKTARVILKIAAFGDEYIYMGREQKVSNVKIHSGAATYSADAVSGSATELTPYTTDNGEVNSLYTALVIPTAAQATETFISVVDGGSYTLLTKGIPAMEAGKSYTYNLKVGKDDVVITSITVNDWTTGEAIPDGESELPIFDVWDGSVASGFASGTGTKESPYLIKTASQLAYLAINTDNHGGAYYTLMSHIDLNGMDWTPIGASNHSYGVFDGNGSIIKGLKVSGDIAFAGLFGHITNVLHNTTTTYPSGVYNLSIVDADVSSNRASAFCGILAGRVAQHQQGSAYIGEMVDVSNVEVSGKISATGLESICGGLAGTIAKVNLANCKSDIHISATGSYFGGLCGNLIGSSVSKCSVSGKIEATSYDRIGGFAGQITTSKLQNCFTENMIIFVSSRSEAPIGGFVGYADDQVQITSCQVNNSQIECGAQGGAFAGFLGTPVTVKECTASGSITGTWTLGGFVGNGFDSNTVISHCTTSAIVTANNWNVGGFVGFSKATIDNCTASGNVTSTANWGDHNYKTGGFAGTNAGVIKNSVYSGTLRGGDTAAEAWKYYGGFIGNTNNGRTVNCRFDGTKNPDYSISGLSWVNEGSIDGNDISDSL